LSANQDHCCDRVNTESIQPRSIPGKLSGDERRAWEESILINSDLKGSRLLVVLTLLNQWCWGKCWCFPSDELLARKCGLGTATINRCLRDLKRLGVIRVVRHRGRRRIVFPSHPSARGYLAGLETPDHHDFCGPPGDRRSDREDGAGDHGDCLSLKTPVSEAPDEDGPSSSPLLGWTPEETALVVEALAGVSAAPAAALESVRVRHPSATPEAIVSACTGALAKRDLPPARRFAYVLGTLANRIREGTLRPPAAPPPRPVERPYNPPSYGAYVRPGGERIPGSDEALRAAMAGSR
jgi:hypothetical protein